MRDGIIILVLFNLLIITTIRLFVISKLNRNQAKSIQEKMEKNSALQLELVCLQMRYLPQMKRQTDKEKDNKRVFKLSNFEVHIARYFDEIAVVGPSGNGLSFTAEMLSKIHLEAIKYRMFEDPDNTGTKTNPMAKRSCFKCGLVFDPDEVKKAFIFNIEDNKLYCHDCAVSVVSDKF